MAVEHEKLIKQNENSRSMKGQDYSRYRLGWKEWVTVTAVYLGLDLLICALFYNSLAAAVIFLPGYILFARICAQWLGRRRQKQLKRQFREWMMILYSLIAAGNSLETAINASYSEISENLDEDSDMMRELRLMRKKMEMNISAIACLEDFAERSGDEDIQNFYEIMNIARQQGGSMRQIVRSSIDRINEKIEMESEIETVIAGKKNEFLIMVVIPLAMILYMRLTSPELMGTLYSGFAGRAVMTVALGVYLAAISLGVSIVRIEV